MPRGRSFRSAHWVVFAALTASAACAPGPLPILARISYGPLPEEAARIADVGDAAYIDEQLHPESIDDTAFEARLAGFSTLALSLGDVARLYGSGGTNHPEIPKRELVDAKILRAAYSRRQLEALLIDFWTNHFQVRDSGLTIGAFERDAIRPFVLGRFEDMLVATARSPAMMIFLDTIFNVRDGLPGDRGINENYARELLELHTVGVESGFTQQDVIDLARCFTGWNVDWTRPDGFEYVDYFHDKGEKHVMGLVLAAGGGEDDGLRALAYLASHPSTAHRIATKLVRRFVDETPPPRLVDAAADTFLASGGDLRAVTSMILHSEAMRVHAERRGKIKRPLVLLASTIRALGMEVQDDLASYRDLLALLGEYPYAATDPRGYPEDSAYWLAPGALLARLQLVQWMALHAQQEGVDFGVTGSEPSSELVQLLVARFGMSALAPDTAAPIEAYAERLLPVSPATRIGEVAGLVLSTTRFMTH